MGRQPSLNVLGMAQADEVKLQEVRRMQTLECALIVHWQIEISREDM